MIRDHLLNRLRNLLYFGLRYRWVRRGRNVHVQWSTTMWSPHRHIVLGDDVGIGPRCTFLADIEIGSKVMMAGQVALIGSDDHRTDLAGVAMWDAPRGDARKIVIEDDVWIGFGAIILSGSHIGRGSVIGAGSVVSGEVEPYAIMVPRKATLLRKRFPPEVLRELQARGAGRRGSGSAPPVAGPAEAPTGSQIVR